MTETTNIPPQNLEAEENVVGAMLLSPNAIDAVSEHVSAADFYRESHSRIFQAALDLHHLGDAVDSITVVDLLEQRGTLEQVGGRARVYELAALVPATANAAHHARIVREQATLRGLVRAGAEIARLGQDRPGDTPDLLDRAEQLVFDLTVGRAADGLVPARDAIGPAFTALQERAALGRDVIGTATGYKALDDVTSGLQPGNLVVLAARPSMGKSALALGCASHAALRLELPAALFTLEMSQAEVMQRLMSTEALVNSQKVRNGRGLDAEEWARLSAASSRIAQAPLHVDDSSLLTVADVRSRARRLKMRSPDLALVVVDYIQLMTGGGSEENRVQEVSRISRALKVLAGELAVPVLALSQLSRAVEQRHDKRPILSDLRESGAIEQDADVVLFLYRDEYYNPEDTDQQGLAEVNVAKQRNGPTTTVKLSFQKRHARFGDLAPPGLTG